MNSTDNAAVNTSAPAAEAVETPIPHLKPPVDQAGLAHRALRRDDWTAERLMAHMGKDKKVLEGRLTFILARGIGQSFITREVAADDLRTFLEETLTA